MQVVLGCPNTILLEDVYWGTAEDANTNYY